MKGSPTPRTGGALIWEPCEDGSGILMLVRLTFLTIQVASAGAVILPLLIHAWLNRGWNRLPLPVPDACSDADLPRLCVVIPTWNEANVIETKLTNLLDQRYPSTKVRHVLIDSASTDGTVERARAWAVENDTELEIIQMPARLGKSAAVNRAMDELHPEDEVFVITDAEATIEPGALRRIGRWMKDETVGAVCGTLVEEENGGAYRGWFRWFREGESKADSTPIFEGSIAAYRASALRPIDDRANADDSQLALLVREGGLRALSDGAIRFREQPITIHREKRERAVRRGQGLSRHFWRNRIRWFRGGRWGTILGLNGIQHTITPWLVLLGILAGVAHATTVVLLGWTGGEPMLLDRLMLLVDAIVLASLGIGVAGWRVPLCATILAFLENNVYLVRGMLILRLGISLHKWTPSMSNRRI